jgi:hypothetical protein
MYQWITIFALVVIMIMLIIITYFTWWLYVNYSNDREDIDDAFAEIKQMTDIIITADQLENGTNCQVASTQKNTQLKQVKKTKSMFGFLSNKRNAKVQG